MSDSTLACGRVRRRAADRVRRGGRGLGTLARQGLVRLLDEGLEAADATVTGARQRHPQLGLEGAGVGVQHEDAVGELDGLLDGVGDQEDGAGGGVRVGEQGQQLIAEGLRGQHVQGGERLVHQQHVRLHDQGAGEADALAHPAGELLGVGVLETVQADHVDGPQSPAAALDERYAPCLEAEFDVLLDRQPGHQGEGLEEHGGARVGAGHGCAAVVDGAAGGGQQPGDMAQQGRLARAGLAQEGDDFPFVQGEVDVMEDRQYAPGGAGEVLVEVGHGDDGGVHGVAPEGSGVVVAGAAGHSAQRRWAKRYSRRQNSRLMMTT